MPNEKVMRSLYRRTKSILDPLLAAAVLVLTSPILLLIAVAVVLDDGRPVFFNQLRVGREGAFFKIKKFRSMPLDSPSVASADASHLRVTRVGTIIRRLSLDELPQVWNIVSGDMAFIGPRPALPTQLELLSGRRANGSSLIKPGLTGLAQVKGYEGMGEQEKSELDGEYLLRESLLTDLKILSLTAVYLFKSPPRV